MPRPHQGLQPAAVELAPGLSSTDQSEIKSLTIHYELTIEWKLRLQAEVQSLHADGQVNLQTRSSKYGRVS